jgi:hypothetical protein
MAQLIDLGKIRFDYKGAYSASTQYELNDVVKENNNVYVYTNGAATTGNATSDTNYWDIMVDGFDVSTDITLADSSTTEVPTENAVKTYVDTEVTSARAYTDTEITSARAYTDTEIAGLADSAPETLNTLNELAAALGDDANFSATVTNSIATKLPLAGGTLTGALVATDITLSGNVSGSYTNLQPEQTASSVTSSHVVNMNEPLHIITMTGATNFTFSNVAEGKITMIKLYAPSSTPPSFGSDTKWPDATEPTWADYDYWLISVVAHSSSVTLASASGYTV